MGGQAFVKRDEVYLQHILDTIDRIITYTDGAGPRRTPTTFARAPAHPTLTAAGTR